MKIMGTQAFDESINIKPVTKGRLFGKTFMIENRLGWKNMLKSGDVVSVKREGETQATPYVFLSYDDIMKFDYIKVFGIYTHYVKDAKQGILLRYDLLSDSFRHYRIKSFFDENMTMRFESTRITEIRRSKTKPKQPFTRDYVISLETAEKSLVAIYKESHSVDEGLHISPVTRERLFDTAAIPRIYERDGWKNLLKNGDIVVTRDKSYVYVSKQIFEEQGYSEQMNIYRKDVESEEGFFVRYGLGEKYGNDLAYVKLSSLSDTALCSFDSALLAGGVLIMAIYRPQNPPLKSDKFIEYAKDITRLLVPNGSEESNYKFIKLKNYLNSYGGDKCMFTRKGGAIQDSI